MNNPFNGPLQYQICRYVTTDDKGNPRVYWEVKCPRVVVATWQGDIAVGGLLKTGFKVTSEAEAFAERHARVHGFSPWIYHAIA